uniref:Translational regulator CsrA n=1 Tax=Thermorudis peleae TaxID=1382356 RepID=A0A831X1G6_9BACT
MLVLSRRPGEALVIGDGIRVVILSVEGERVRVGIEAPREVPVLRAELAEAVSDENTRAARTGAQRDLLGRLHSRLKSPPPSSHQGRR